MASALASCVVTSARPEEHTAALSVFFHHLADDERAARVARVAGIFARGELNADGLFVCHSGEVLAGTMVGVVLPGATGMVWPPRALAGTQQHVVEDSLVRHANLWLCQRGCKFGQALLGTSEALVAAALERNGYKYITNLLYMRKDLAAEHDAVGDEEHVGMTFEDYNQCDQEVFRATLLASYEDTLDCPELNDTRTAAEVIAGYNGLEGCRQEHWWLARYEQRPAGVLIVTEHAASKTWDLSYLGLVRAARGRGLGRVLTRKALREAITAGALSMTLTMDERNEPAWRLYRSFNFDVYDQRQVFLALFTEPVGPTK
jgi:mycothiol synthase